MPEHCHIIVRSRDETYAIGDNLRAIKSPSAKAMPALRPDLRDHVRIRRNGRPDEFRVWQKGGGYDRNLVTVKTFRATIAYIHANPVRRGLCEAMFDWPYSSARAYHELDPPIPVDFPHLED